MNHQRLKRQEEVMRTMKMSSVLAVAFVGMFVGTAHAQETMVARVPFPFVVRGEEFPAGSYEVKRKTAG